MTGTAPPGSLNLLDQLLVDSCVLLAPAPDLHAALLDQLLDSTEGPATLLVTACLYSLALRPGLGDHLAEHLSAVAAAAHDVERGHRSECRFCHLETRQLLDDAVGALRYLLGDQALNDLRAIVNVGRPGAA